MPRCTKFSEEWLKRTIVDDDGEEHMVSIWCEANPESEYFPKCRLCNKHFSISNMGFGQIESHAKNGKKHKAKVKNFLNRQSVFVTISTKDNGAISASSSSSAPVNCQKKISNGFLQL